jgi:hypothetical protein
VRGQRQLAIAIDAQAFTLYAMQALGKQGEVGVLAEQGQAAGEQVAQDCIPSRIGRPNMGVSSALYKGGRMTDVGRLVGPAAAERSRGLVWPSRRACWAACRLNGASYNPA